MYDDLGFNGSQRIAAQARVTEWKRRRKGTLVMLPLPLKMLCPLFFSPHSQLRRYAYSKEISATPASREPAAQSP